MAEIIDGKKLSYEIKDELKQRIIKLKEEKHQEPLAQRLN